MRWRRVLEDDKKVRTEENSQAAASEKAKPASRLEHSDSCLTITSILSALSPKFSFRQVPVVRRFYKSLSIMSESVIRSL